jgi:hypothetical protein
MAYILSIKSGFLQKLAFRKALFNTFIQFKSFENLEKVNNQYFVNVSIIHFIFISIIYNHRPHCLHELHLRVRRVYKLRCEG